MPSYDPLVHYAGLGSDPRTAIVWVREGASSDAIQSALLGVMILACMDDGEAGSKWKSFYDLASAADARVPASAPDPYLNRHKLVQAIIGSL
ncbi:MAG TPA: hypothetical protein VIN40_07210 [Candidatus Tyrphobacter sp.]